MDPASVRGTATRVFLGALESGYGQDMALHLAVRSLRSVECDVALAAGVAVVAAPG